MIREPNLNEIKRLFQSNNLNKKIVNFQVMTGTTSGVVIKVEAERGDKYVLKFDHPSEINLAVRFLKGYQNSELLPNIFFVSLDRIYLVRQ